MVARVLGVRSLLADERRFSPLGEQGRNPAAAGYLPLTANPKNMPRIAPGVTLLQIAGFG